MISNLLNKLTATLVSALGNLQNTRTRSDRSKIMKYVYARENEEHNTWRRCRWREDKKVFVGKTQ
jgi:hypothetical protein